jgi:undecaprenyl-diphosphatase
VSHPEPAARFTARSVAGLVAVLAAGAAFGLVLALVRTRWPPLDRFDRGTAATLNRLVSEHPLVIHVLRAVTDLGSPLVITVLLAAGVVTLLIRRQPQLAAYLAATGLGAVVLERTIKLLVGRLRPVVADPIATASGNSFPSGHALGSAAGYGALLLVSLPLMPRRFRAPLIGTTATLVAAIGFTRIALGVHYVSDVVGAWLLAGVWLGLTGYAFRLWQRETTGHRHIERAPAILAVLWVLVIGAVFLLGALVAPPGRPARIGNPVLIVAIVAVLVALIASRRRVAVFLAVAMLGELVAVVALHQARHSTFPDSRVAAVVTGFGALAVLAVASTRSWWRWLAVAAAVVVMAVVVLPALGHGGRPAADAAGGLLLAAAWLAAIGYALPPVVRAARADPVPREVSSSRPRC